MDETKTDTGHAPDSRLPAPFEDVHRTLSVEQRRCLYWRFMTGGKSHAEAAEVAGVSTKTIYRWLQREDFKRWWDDPESWYNREVRSQRDGLELKSLMMAHALLDNPTVADGVKADVMAKALTDVRQTKQIHADRATGEAWAALIEQWAQRSEEILGIASEDTAPAIEVEAIPADEPAGHT